ncbi:hypothetical protein H9623_13125 [Oerskovia sp. Sa1BUA8]|uniref:Uncharacterized protein n=1 Tax=Oerskovia douganii TaxID=2762210 RepID=A0A9D5U9Y2_9CELL|nr:hypothetical protein [Oerskovia douganii]MBE7701238.1 hypothetical protein [Oerskovia douganii]
MSTDDLTPRAREWARTRATGIGALVSELADEVDRLRAENERYRNLWDRHGKNDLLAERDAARAALERVRALTDRIEGIDSDFAHRKTIVTHLRIAALEGKPS